MNKYGNILSGATLLVLVVLLYLTVFGQSRPDTYTGQVKDFEGRLVPLLKVGGRGLTASNLVSGVDQEATLESLFGAKDIQETRRVQVQGCTWLYVDAVRKDGSKGSYVFVLHGDLPGMKMSVYRDKQ